MVDEDKAVNSAPANGTQFDMQIVQEEKELSGTCTSRDNPPLFQDLHLGMWYHHHYCCIDEVEEDNDDDGGNMFSYVETFQRICFPCKLNSQCFQILAPSRPPDDDDWDRRGIR